MTEWPMVTVSDLESEGVLLVQDGNHGEYRPRPHEFEAEGTPFIRATELSDGLVDFVGAGRINEVARQRVRKGVGAPGDVLFSHKGTVGKLARVPLEAEDFVCSPQTTFWRTIDETRLRRDYLYCYMRSRLFIDQWWVRKGETDMADYVSLTAQRQLRVMLPPVDVQRGIAKPIAVMDDLIENNRRRVDVLEEMARAIYREWFVHFRFPGHDGPNFVDSGLGPIPEGWSVRSLGEVMTLQYGRALKKADRQGGDVAVLGSSGVVGWHDKAVVAGPVIVVGRKGNVGSITWVDEDAWPIDTTYFVETELPLRFVCEQLRAIEFLNTHAAVPGLSRDQAYSKPFLEPDGSLMAGFDAVSETLLREASLLRAQADRLRTMRDMLLPKLVTGQIDVSDLDLDSVVEKAGI